jgi:hypothetical protein
VARDNALTAIGLYGSPPRRTHALGFAAACCTRHSELRGVSAMLGRRPSTEAALLLLTGTDMPSGRRMLWRFAVTIVLVESLAFWLGLVPDDAAHWLLLRTRILVLLGPPLAFSSAGVLSHGIGIVGSLAFLSILRRGLTVRRRMESVGWVVASLVLWGVFGILAATPLV